MESSQPTQKSMLASVITSSDRASSGVYEDKSGEQACLWLRQNRFKIESSMVIPDDAKALETAIDACLKVSDLVVISGGTGIGPRDITPQTLDQICDYSIAGFGELLRKESLKYSLNAYLSRCGGWVKNQTLLLALPGNPKAVVEQLDILKDLLPHALLALRGKCAHRRRQETPSS